MDRGFIVHAAERIRGGKTEIHLVGRLETGETFAVIEQRLRPFLYVRQSDAERASVLVLQAGQPWNGDASGRHTMDGEPAVKIESPTVSASQRLRDQLHREGIRTYEGDVKTSAQLLMDLRVHGTVGIEGGWRPGRRVSRIYENPTLQPAALEPRLSVLSVDIETDRKANVVYAVALAFVDLTGERTDEVFLNRARTSVEAPSAVSCADERDLFSRIRERILAMDPDVITGWNVVDFDIRVLARRYADQGVPFDIGRSDETASFLDRESGDSGMRWRRSKAIVPGRQVLDGLWLVRFAGMGLEDYRLETVAQSVLGRGKRIEELPGESRTAAVERLYREDPESLCVYCREDARLVLDILAHEGLLELALHKSLLIGTSLEQTSLSVASFEFLYLEHLHQRQIVGPTLGIDQEEIGRAPGGGIITPRAGLFSSVLAFDFKSLYPSIMRTFNIDPLGMVRASQTDPQGGALRGPIVAPNGARFRRDPGILPGILDRFFESREEARQRGDRRAVYAYKIVMNSFYGVLGTSGCRFAAGSLAGAITTLGQHVLFWARDQVIAEGLDVIYGDTDSLFVLAGGSRDAPMEELLATGARIAGIINDRLAAYVTEHYQVRSRMELEFEAVYRRFFLPPMRTAGPASEDGEDDYESRGRAKGYAGLRVARGNHGDTASVDIVGLEAVRHDWTPLAQELQREMLTLVFADAPASAVADLVRVRIRELRAGALDAKLSYRKSLRKPVEAYTRSSPPHARAAALLPLEERTGLIRYVWTLEGPQPEGRTTAAPDYDHYVEKQLRPIVEAVAPYINLQTEELFAAGGQLALF